MRTIRNLLTLMLLLLVISAGRESHAVIYKYVDGQGGIAFVDDLLKVPEQLRASAVRVSGDDAALEQSTDGRMTTAAETDALRQEHAAVPAKARGAFPSRLILSGCSVAAVIALLFLLPHIDVLRERTRVLNGIRAGLIAGLFVLVPIVHGNDVARLFRQAGDAVSSPFTEVQEEQATRGKKAAQAMKAFNRMLEQVEQKSPDDAQRLEEAVDEAERGK
jgi:hypothetical protein